jgi:hypothetical protein
MENLNTEQVKRELEGLVAFRTCPEYIKSALALINSQEQRIGELTEENERLRSDTVREMQERLKGRNEVYCVNKADLKTMNFVVDQIAKEMLEGEK